MKSYAIIGTGAIGGYCGVRLQQAGFDVHCLLNSDYEFVKQYGLTLITSQGKVTLPVNAYNNIQQMPICDVILIAIKTTANAILKEILPKIMHPGSVVIILQNGIGIEKEIAEFIEATKIIGGSCNIKVTKISPGIIKQDRFDGIELAQYYPDEQQTGIPPQVEQLAENFKKAGINAVTSPHLPTIRWKKLAANIPPGLSIILNDSMQELVLNSASYQLLLAVTREVITTAIQCGANIPNDFYQWRIDVLESFKEMPIQYSIQEDFNAKRPLEIHAIYENAINIARYHNVPMPLTEMLCQQLFYLNAKNIL